MIVARLGANRASATTDQPMPPTSHSGGPAIRPPAGQDRDGGQGGHQDHGDHGRDEAFRDQAHERPRDRPQADDRDPAQRPAVTRGAAAPAGEVGEDRARLREVVGQVVHDQRQVPGDDDRGRAGTRTEQGSRRLPCRAPPPQIQRPDEGQWREGDHAQDVTLHRDHRAQRGQQPPASRSATATPGARRRTRRRPRAGSGWGSR